MNYLKQVLLLLTALILLSSCSINSSKNDAPRKIEVIGSAETEIMPDEIYVSFTIKEYLDISRKKVKLEDVKTEFLAACKNANIPDSTITISNYSGNDYWDYFWYKRKKTEPEFLSSISYTIKLKSSDVLDKLINSLNDNVLDNFMISKTTHSTIEQLRKETKIRALQASKEKAISLATSIGEEVGEALNIQEIDDGSSSQVYYKESLVSNSSYNAYTAPAQGTSPVFEKIKIRCEVRAEYKLK